MFVENILFPCQVACTGTCCVNSKQNKIQVIEKAKWDDKIYITTRFYLMSIHSCYMKHWKPIRIICTGV